ncbi:MAG: hypothetical protein M1820_000592 [Bogoriella megaspora]|nr:MAG: hypothetical protein M1820_000592 [Bogoriella megaspora]
MSGDSRENLSSSTDQQSSPAATAPKAPFYFREQYSRLIVRGNFMTLAAKPMVIDDGEWLAHQIVEQYRLLNEMLKIIQEVNHNTGMPICNPRSCPTMSGGGGHTYTWLDQAGRPCRISAAHYISSVQRWIKSKIDDPSTFPIEIEPPLNGLSVSAISSGMLTPGTTPPPIPAGPTSLSQPLSQLSGPAARAWLGKPAGFPENFESDVRSMYKQMMRCYCHLYHAHWLDPFYHLDSNKELNTCFIHFVNVGKLFGILDDKDMEPLRPLVDIWVDKNLLPSVVAAGSGSLNPSATIKEGSSPGPSTGGTGGVGQAVSA